MNLKMDVWSVLLLVGVIQGVFITPLLLKKSRPGKWLALMVGVISLNLANYLLISTELYRAVPHLIMISQPVLFLIGPAYYFYIRSLLDKTFRIKLKHYPHFLSFLTALLYHIPFYMLDSGSKIELINAYSNQEEFRPSIHVNIYYILLITQILGYIIYTSKKIRESPPSGLNRDSSFLNWLHGFNIVFIAYWVLDILWNLYRMLFNLFILKADYVIVLSSALLINFLAYKALYHNEKFKYYFLGLFSEKYRKSSLSKDQSKGILKKIIRLMEEEKLYLNPELKMANLASQLSISTNILSQVLNQELGKNFFEVINEYRISEAVKRLSDQRFSHLTILSIAMDSGFNSKNTFYKLFKAHTGVTPTQFIRNQSL